MFRGIAGFYSILGAVDYTAVIFSAHLVAVECKVITIREDNYALDQQPSWQIPQCPVRMREYLSERGLLNRRGGKKKKKKTYDRESQLIIRIITILYRLL